MGKNKFLKLFSGVETIYVNESNITHIEKSGGNDIAIYVIGKTEPIIATSYYDKIDTMLSETLALSDIS